MTDYIQRIENIDWQLISEAMHTHGYAMLPKILKSEDCDSLKTRYNATDLYRKTISMERYRFGLGEYKYFSYPLPGIIQELREKIYSRLSPMANKWMEVLNMPQRFPETHEGLQTICKRNDQDKPTVLILKYEAGGFNTLHQDLYGDVFFPIQAVVFLSEPDLDYTGGEFILIQQTPRAQSKAIVLKPQKGDVVIFTTNFRPVKGSKGYYRANMKHGVSEVLTGSRYTLGIIFHDALS